MKNGLKGYQSGCTPPFDVWGISINAPCIQPYMIEPGPIQTWAIGFSYDLYGSQANTHQGSEPRQVKIVPDLFPRVSGGTSWPMFAAKVPSSYPYGSCNHTSTPDSSKADGTWSVELETVIEHGEHNEQDTIDYWRWVFQSRAIYVDWEQKFVVYRFSSKHTDFGLTVFQATPGAEVFGTFSVIDIKQQTIPISIDTTFSEYTIDGNLQQYQSTQTEMEYGFPFILLDSPGTFNSQLGYDDSQQPVAQAISYGQEYLLASSYNPNSTFGASWLIGRIRYRGTRLGVTPSAEFFSSRPLTVGTGQYVNPLLITLPSCRVFIKSDALQPDECWVVAISNNNGIPKLATGRWLNKDYSIEYGDGTEEHGFADGTLRETEVENWIINLDNSSQHHIQPVPGESWDDIRVRCYNHIDGQDLLLFTSNSAGSEKTAIPTADFEGGIDSGLPDGFNFINGGTAELDIWVPSTDYKKNGTYSAKTSFQDVTKNAEVSMRLSVHVVNNNSTLTFWYMHDNRRYGYHQTGPPWTSLTNFPEVDNVFEFRVDGNLIPITIDGNSYNTSRIDNVFVPSDNNNTEAWYYTWRHVSVTLSAGTHTLSWTTKQVWQVNGQLQTWLDDIVFPLVLISDDVDAKKRWFYAAGKVRQAKYWAWKKQDDEDDTTIDEQRTSRTVPDFITMDRQGRIYYGNPHYVCRILIDDNGDDYIDESFGGPPFNGASGNGYVRFTATTNIEQEPPCLDPNIAWVSNDIIDDPRWGAFQIMPIETGIQIRGANAAIRDATEDPLDKDSFTFPKNKHGLDKETFVYFTKSLGRWSQRISSWNISDDGKNAMPHIEVLWRPTSQAPAWPDAPDNGATPKWPSPPYRSDFETAKPNDPEILAFIGAQIGAVMRPRDIFNLDKNDESTRWSHINYVIPRGYSDALTQLPQYVWWRESDDPPSWDGMGDMPEGYWHPDWPVDYAQGLGVRGGPYPSVDWHLIQARFDPTGWRWHAWQQQGSWLELIHCPDDDEEVTTQLYRWVIEHREMWWPYTDFDAVDSGQGICYEENA